MREVVAQMASPAATSSTEQMAPYLRDVDDHVQRAVEAIDGLRDVLGTILDTNLTLASNRLNETVLPADRVGRDPGRHHGGHRLLRPERPVPRLAASRGGFVASTVLLVVRSRGLYAFFKRKGWL